MQVVYILVVYFNTKKKCRLESYGVSKSWFGSTIKRNELEMDGT